MPLLAGAMASPERNLIPEMPEASMTRTSDPVLVTSKICFVVRAPTSSVPLAGSDPSPSQSVGPNFPTSKCVIRSFPSPNTPFTGLIS